MKSALILFFTLFVSEGNSFPQIERETRAVWIATNHRLDWPPPTFNIEKQKTALEGILDTVKLKNLNTVYFQTRSNGSVLFKSTMDPFSPLITGTSNISDGYDPLKFAVEQAHERGLEIHAWINCVNVFSGADISTVKNPDHITKRKPEWIIEDYRDGVKSYWLDPGLPEVRDYLSDMIAEMVENYDVDGVQLDYIRYPGKNFDDEFSYGIFGNGKNKDNWRRNNITMLIEEINKKIKNIKPFVKLGATPVGVYKNLKGMYAWEGYSQVYQDSREWLKRGIVDYLAPQVYWGLDENPQFDVVAKNWAENSFGKNIVIGLGAYKDNVRYQLGKMIDYSRKIGASGVSFYRYKNIAGIDFKSFESKAFPSQMAWLHDDNPESPQDLSYTIENEDKNIISFNWDIAEDGEQNGVSYFALYNLPNPNADSSPEYLYDVIPADKTSAAISFKPEKINYYFALKSVNKLWNESLESSNVVKINFDSFGSLANLDSVRQNPVLLKQEDGTSKILLFSKSDEKIEVYGKEEFDFTKIISGDISPGKNIIDLPVDISIYRVLKIVFEYSKREVELKF